MSDLPPRRSRPPSNDAEASLPLIPILIGVIVLGFIIGAGLSIARRHAAPPAVAVDTATRPPATEAPVTPAPTEKPTVTPTVAPAAAPSETDAATEAPTEAATGSPANEAANSPTPSAASAKPTRTPQRATPSPSAPAVPTGAPSVAVAHSGPAPNPAMQATRPAATRQLATATAATSVPAATDAPASSDDVDSDFGHLASAVVRQYLGAIARGDTASAYAAFGAAPGDGNVKLTETGIVGPSAHIAHVEVRGAGDNATVNVDLKTAAGIYSAQYTVHRTPSGAALIVDHSIVKP